MFVGLAFLGIQQAAAVSSADGAGSAAFLLTGVRPKTTRTGGVCNNVQTGWGAQTFAVLYVTCKSMMTVSTRRVLQYLSGANNFSESCTDGTLYGGKVAQAGLIRIRFALFSVAW